MAEKMGLIRHRYVICAMVFSGLFLVYAMRVNLSVSIIAMVKPSHDPSDNTTFEGTCPIDSSHTQSNSTTVHGDLDWDAKHQSYALLAFFFGYISTQILGGILAETTSIKWILGYGIFCTSCLTLLTEVVAKWNIYAFIVLRVLEGVTEGVTFPSTYSLMARWSPKQERSTMLNMCTVGALVGTIVTLPVAAALCQSKWGWPAAFYIPGVLGIIWSILWYLVVTSSPEKHKWISEEERNYIIENRGELSFNKKRKIPWTSILTSRAVWALCASRFSAGFIFYIFLTEMPTFFDNIFHINLSENGSLNGAFYLCNAISASLSGVLADRLIHRYNIKVNTIRKLFEMVASVSSCVLLLSVVLVRCNWTPIPYFLCLAMVSLGHSAGGNAMVAIDIAPEISGFVMGFANMMGNVSGIVAPFMVGQIIEKRSTIDQWHTVFYMTIGVTLAGNLIFLLFGSTEEQEWAKQQEDEIVVVASDLKKEECSME